MMMISQKSLLPLLALTFCTWCVYLGGLAAMQSVCPDVPSNYGTSNLGQGQGFPASQPCSAVYSFWWFVMAFEFFVIALTIIAAVSKTMLYTSRWAMMGLFVIATYLFIEACRSFYSLEATQDMYWGNPNGTYVHRIRTVVAGAIMTAIMNGLVVICLGMREEHDTYHDRGVVVEKPVGVVTTTTHHTGHTGIATAV